MGKKSFLYLFVITFVLSLLALVSHLIQPKFETTISKGVLVFKNVNEQLNNINKINIDNGIKKIVIKRNESDWVMESKFNYKVNEEIIKKKLIKVSQLRFFEKKTKEEFLYSRLDLHYPKDEEGNSKLISIHIGENNILSQFILGKSKKNGVYIKKLDEKQSWLTSGILKMSVNEIDWLESVIFNVDYEKIKNIKVEHSDKSILLLSKDDKNENLIIKNLSKGDLPKSDLIANFLGEFLSNLSFEDVSIRKKNYENNVITNITYELFENTFINAIVFKDDNEKWINFNVDEESFNYLEKENNILVENIENWSYKLSSSKYNTVETKLKDLLVED